MSRFSFKKYFITGGAGFIGAHLANAILGSSAETTVTVFDNFSNGRRWAFGTWLNDRRLTIIEGDARDSEKLLGCIGGHEIVYHLAANADIAKAMILPTIDFENGTYTTNNVLEAMRKTNVRRMVFTSGSGVYGDVPPVPISENYDRMIPISTYGANKLSSEVLISAYCYMFGMTGTVFRFANVVGPHQTHGVAYDFIRRLANNASQLKILGDGSQSKPYIYIDDIISAFQLLEEKNHRCYDVFNVGTEDYLTVREIADIVCECMQLSRVDYQFTGGARGWKADVPVYRLNVNKIKKMGWRPKQDSRQAVTASVMAMLDDLREGRIPLASEV